jgi:hypothetical protein
MANSQSRAWQKQTNTSNQEKIMVRSNRKSALSRLILGAFVIAGSLVLTQTASAQFKPLLPPGPIYIAPPPPPPPQKRVITGTIQWTLDPRTPSNSATSRKGIYVGSFYLQRSDMANAPRILVSTDGTGHFKHNVPVGPYFVQLPSTKVAGGKGVISYSSPVIMVWPTGGTSYSIQVIKSGPGS